MAEFARTCLRTEKNRGVFGGCADTHSAIEATWGLLAYSRHEAVEAQNIKLVKSVLADIASWTPPRDEISFYRPWDLHARSRVSQR